MFEPTGELVDYAAYDTLSRSTVAMSRSRCQTWPLPIHRPNGGRTFTFMLNPKARFSDGTPVTAQDVVFSSGAWST